ncbi:MAG: metal-sensitive transcriptional regulator [Gemmatimonadaceae bacterium]|nr:metal-sensitive transcriptional regulator [Gemmatimonadaceae bacterium]
MRKVITGDTGARPRARKKPSRTEKKRSVSEHEGRASLPAVASSVDDLYLTGDAERAIYNRLSRLEGQVRGVKKMLAEHKSCDEMLVQISALKQAVNGVAAELLQAHMETCVLGRIEAGEGKRALTSLRNALAKVMKHG